MLEFNDKTQLMTIKNGVDYLGFHFYLTDTGKVIRRLRTSSKKRLKRRLKKFQKQYKQDEVKLEDITQSIASYKGHLKHGHTDRLRQKLFRDFVLTKENTGGGNDRRMQSIEEDEMQTTEMKSNT